MSAKGVTVEAENSDSTVTNYLMDNPRMIGVLFTILMLVSQAGTVAAGNNASISGP